MPVVPEACRASRTKPEIALAEIDRVMATGLTFGTHQQMKEELGLDHFEGRSWTGLHRHALMTMIAFAFLQHRRLKAGGGKKNRPRPAPAEPARDPESDHGRSRAAPA